MESPDLINKKWMICTITSFIGCFLLVLCLDHVRRHGLGVVSLGDIDTSESFFSSLGVKSTKPISASPPTVVKTSPPPPPPPAIAKVELTNPSDVIESEVVEVELSPPPPPPPPSPPPPPPKCDVFSGRWVYDEAAYPLYHAWQCPFLSDQVSCQKNGRPDSGYEHWRWEPFDCKLPRFDGKDMLERMRGKRVVIAGDSLNRNQWESLTCLLYSVLPPSRAFVKARSSEHKIFKALDYGFTLEFFWSPFLINFYAKQGEKTVLKLEEISPMAPAWRGADIMVFNTGHWWTHRGKFRKWDYMEYKGKMIENIETDVAYRLALRTWARWIDGNVDPARTAVFFRSISPEHKPQNHHWCYNQTQPISDEPYIPLFPGSLIDIAETTIRDMKTAVKYLNITHLSEYRRDGHTSVYTVRQGKLLTQEQRLQPQNYADCSHWCLPGLPDTWNSLIYASAVLHKPGILL
ncbi:hypothetical protein QJS10_CPA03g00141 [Acorus calamus]|uniref:Trichome birefringence-like N-terminal domain-containing protein n=1 Tax=Acorus calamus TaxID=4465 RepID=A0AAV9F400_ACOCL|nr:hypothetical protein QJS10_CPA03g00141 [Acorus calamus]